MVFLNKLLATAVLATTALCAPSPKAAPRSVKEALIEAYGPIDTWQPIRAIDLYPNATFDGVPVNESVIWGYEPPKTSTPTMHKRAAELTEAAEDLSKRDYHYTCYNSGNWVSQNQLWAGKDNFCGEINAAGGLGTGQAKWQSKLYYPASDGSFQRFTNQEGKLVSVFYYVKVRDGSVWSYNLCFNSLYEVIYKCKGSNPDSAGGASWEYQNAFDATVDPEE